MIGTEQVKFGTDKETKEPIYETKDIKGDVKIAVFRTPDITERVAALEVENESLKATVGTLLLTSLEV